ncbi:Os02g0729566 [Oryza sativa Japonica Group]|uniref:Os02g0729566 protein n=1 Tax=Oryza sativa subsp. japonica TaxID=39947 RepID=A0A0P0VP55_ORYSJ|nr:Os02g0729566 [Oryza sativa Japonica Group]
MRAILSVSVSLLRRKMRQPRWTRCIHARPSTTPQSMSASTANTSEMSPVRPAPVSSSAVNPSSAIGRVGPFHIPRDCKEAMYAIRKSQLRRTLVPESRNHQENPPTCSM